MPPQYEDDDEEDKKPGPPAGFTEDQDRWNLQGKGPVARPGAPAAAAAKPAQRQARGGTEPSGDEEIERMSRMSGVYGQKEHPEVGLASEGIEDIRSGEYQRGAHKLFGALGETLRPLAPLMGEAGLKPLVQGLGASIIGGQVGKHVLPAIGITPELGEDIGTYGAPLALPRAIYRATREGTSYEPRTPYRAGRPELTGPGEPAPEGLPRTRAAGAPPQAAAAAAPIAPISPEAVASPTPTSALDYWARKLFGLPYDMLRAEDKQVVARNLGGGPPEGIERRVTRGEAPGVMERRAENMPLPTRAPEAGAPGIARPGQPGAEPAPSGTLPRIPPPTTLGGQPVPRASLDEILRQATGQKAPEKPPPGEPLRRGQPIEEGKPPPVDPLKQEFPDAAIRQFARANGAELVRAAGENMDAVQAVHDLSNVEVRQAAINAGIDVGQKHVGSRMLLGEAQVSRQNLIDQMIRQGVKAEDIPRLAGKEAVPYTKPMPIPESSKNTRFGVTEPFIHHHELAHAIIAGEHGFNPEDIASHRHPITKGVRAAASVLFDFRQFGPNLSKLGQGAEGAEVGQKFLEVLAGGQAAGEVIDGMAKDVNFTASGDKNMAARFLTAMGIPKYRWVEMWDAAYDRAKAKLTPEVVAIIKDEATRREDNLPAIYHYSGNRVAHIVEKVRDAREQAKAAAGYAGAVGEQVGREGQQALPFEESRAPEGPVRPPGAQTLKPYRAPQYTYTFKVEGREGIPEREIQLQAVDRKTAWKKLDQQGGYLRAEMLREEKPEVGPPLMPKLGPRGSTMGLFEKPAEVGEKPTVADFVEAMRKRNKAAGLKPIIAADQPEAALGRALKIGEAELDFQRMRPNSGEQWYNQDAKRYDNALGKYHEALKDPAKLTIAKAIQAGMSLGNKTIPAVTNTLNAIDHWQKTGRIPLKNPVTGGAWPNGQYNVYMHGFRRLQILIDQKGEAGAGKWLMEQHPVSELRKYSPGVKGSAADMKYGALALGPKFGPFFLNNMGIAEALTTDMWWARTWNRWMGTPFQNVLKDGKRIQKVVEQVRPGERPVMETFAGIVAKKKGLEIKQVQAILWNYEQALYKLHGFQNAEQPSYGQAAEALVRDRIRQRDAQSGAGTPRARQDAGTRRSAGNVRGSP